MPAMHFRVQWPDDAIRDCYSPSTIVKDYLEVGASYPLQEFMDRSRAALNAASERVRAKYGFACSSAMDELQALERLAAGYVVTGSASSNVASSNAASSNTAPIGTAPIGTAPIGTAPVGTAAVGTAPGATASSDTVSAATPLAASPRVTVLAFDS